MEIYLKKRTSLTLSVTTPMLSATLKWVTHHWNALRVLLEYAFDSHLLDVNADGVRQQNRKVHRCASSQMRSSYWQTVWLAVAGIDRSKAPHVEQPVLLVFLFKGAWKQMTGLWNSPGVAWQTLNRSLQPYHFFSLKYIYICGALVPASRLTSVVVRRWGFRQSCTVVSAVSKDFSSPFVWQLCLFRFAPFHFLAICVQDIRRSCPSIRSGLGGSWQQKNSNTFIALFFFSCKCVKR